MRPEHTDLKYLWDMQEAAQRVVRYCDGQTLDSLRANEVLQSALERVIGIIGEAAGEVSRGCREQYPQIAWKPIIATRHILVHDYDEVDQEILWRIATQHVPELIAQLDPILKANPPA